MTTEEIKALIEAEVKRQLASVPRIVVPDLKQVVHRPIISNQPGK